MSVKTSAGFSFDGNWQVMFKIYMAIQKDNWRLIILKNNTERFTMPISNFIRKQNELKWCNVGIRKEQGTESTE